VCDADLIDDEPELAAAFTYTAEPTKPSARGSKALGIVAICAGVLASVAIAWACMSAVGKALHSNLLQPNAFAARAALTGQRPPVKAQPKGTKAQAAKRRPAKASTAKASSTKQARAPSKTARPNDKHAPKATNKTKPTQKASQTAQKPKLKTATTKPASKPTVQAKAAPKAKTSSNRRTTANET
jgi:hypothetical protein